MSRELIPAPKDYAGLVSFMEFYGGASEKKFDIESLKSMRRMYEESENRDARMLYDTELKKLIVCRHSTKVFALDEKGGCWLEVWRRYPRTHLLRYPEYKDKKIRAVYRRGVMPWMLSETGKRDLIVPDKSESSLQTAVRAAKEELKDELEKFANPPIEESLFREVSGLKVSNPPARLSRVYHNVLSIVWPTAVLWRPPVRFPKFFVVKNDADVDVGIRYFPDPPPEVLMAIQNAMLPQ